MSPKTHTASRPARTAAQAGAGRRAAAFKPGDAPARAPGGFFPKDVGALFVCLLLTTSGCLAGPPAIALFFDDPRDDLAIDSSGEGRNLLYRAPGMAKFSTEEKRFGQGGLRIIESPVTLIRQSLLEEPYSALTRSTDQLSVVVWLKFPESGEEESATLNIATRSASAGTEGHWTFLSHPNLGLYFRFKHPDGNSFQVASGPRMLPEIPPGRWTHLAMTFDRGTVTFYLNGESWYGDALDGGDTIGEYRSLQPFFMALGNLPADAHVDDYGIFDQTALSGDDIRAIYEQGLEAFLKKP